MSAFQGLMSFVAGILFLVGFLPYIAAIVRKKTKPSKATWLIWASLDTITLLSMHVEGAINGQIIGATAGAWFVFVLAYLYGMPGWTKLDVLCLSGAVLGVILWLVFSNPVLAILTSQTVTFIGAIPTFVSAWRDPDAEDRVAWTIFWLSCVAAIIAIPAWTLKNAAQPLTFTAIETVMMLLLYRGLISRVYEWCVESRTDNERGKTPLIHPEFCIRWGNWQQNRHAGPAPIEVKVTFAFDDPALLDDCPFVCKVAPHDQDRAKFFGVAYAPERDTDRLKEWTTRFRDRQVRTPEADSQVLEDL